MILESYFYLRDQYAFVTGARHAVIADFSSGRFQRPNEAARKIIALGEQGLTVAGVAERLKSEFNTSDILTFIETLASEGLVVLSEHPKLEITRQSPPVGLDFLWIEVTGRCNLRCIHCYAGADYQKEQGLPVRVITRVLDEASAIGCRKVQFTGGECTLRKDLPDLIAHARSRGFETVEIFTNGTLLDESLVSFLANYGVEVALSLHSSRPEIQDRIAGIPGSFEKIVKSLEYILAYKIPVRCHTIAMKENEQYLAETMYFLHKLGVPTTPADPIRPTGRGTNSEQWPEQYGFLMMRKKPLFSIDREQYEQNHNWNSCWRGKSAITSEGDVIPCVLARTQVAGNVTAASLEEIIMSSAMRNLWSLTNDRVEGCRECEYRYFCRDCRPWAIGSTGDLHDRSPRCAYDPSTGKWPDANY